MPHIVHLQSKAILWPSQYITRLAVDVPDPPFLSASRYTSMFPEKIHIFANVPVDGGKKWIFPDEHDNSTYDNIASFCFEYDPDLPEVCELPYSLC